MPRRKEEFQEQPMIEIIRPVGIVEVWQNIGRGKARILVPIFHKPGKDWWEFPGGGVSAVNDLVRDNIVGEARREIFEESGLTIPDQAETIEIPFSRERFLADTLELVDGKKGRVIQTKPVIFRFVCGDQLPEIELNKSGDIEVDDYRWLDMTSFYRADQYRDVLSLIKETFQSGNLTAFPSSQDNKVLTWKPTGDQDQKSVLNLSDISRKAIFDYASWIMENIPTYNVEFQGLRVE
jgi:8-oxo-dGTP pyrophosphatase MutT (NUDIX family)